MEDAENLQESFFRKEKDPYEEYEDDPDYKAALGEVDEFLGSEKNGPGTRGFEILQFVKSNGDQTIQKAAKKLKVDEQDVIDVICSHLSDLKGDEKSMRDMGLGQALKSMHTPTIAQFVSQRKKELSKQFSRTNGGRGIDDQLGLEKSFDDQFAEMEEQQSRSRYPIPTPGRLAIIGRPGHLVDDTPTNREAYNIPPADFDSKTYSHTDMVRVYQYAADHPAMDPAKIAKNLGLPVVKVRSMLFDYQDGPESARFMQSTENFSGDDEAPRIPGGSPRNPDRNVQDSNPRVYGLTSKGQTLTEAEADRLDITLNDQGQVPMGPIRKREQEFKREYDSLKNKTKGSPIKLEDVFAYVGDASWSDDVTAKVLSQEKDVFDETIGEYIRNEIVKLAHRKKWSYDYCSSYITNNRPWELSRFVSWSKMMYAMSTWAAYDDYKDSF
jgi:hypothetical protein